MKDFVDIFRAPCSNTKKTIVRKTDDNFQVLILSYFLKCPYVALNLGADLGGGGQWVGRPCFFFGAILEQSFFVDPP